MSYSIDPHFILPGTIWTEADGYVRSIRNKAKQSYARAFLAYLRAGGKTSEPDRGELSYMAAQAVRMRLYELNGNLQYPERAQ